MNNKIIIHIDGVQGSGKSYICSKLKNIICIDTDDIMEQTKKKVCLILQKKNFPQKINKKTLKIIQQEENKIIQDIIRNNNIIVFAGMTVNIPNPTYKLFIKINNFTSVYKRLMIRELEKIVKNYKNIKKYIKNTKPVDMNVFNISQQSILFPSKYESFIEDYKERLKEAKLHKYIPKTQEEIINFINKL